MNYRAVTETPFTKDFLCSKILFFAAATHGSFSTNLFHGQITQKHIDQISSPEIIKFSLSKVFGIKRSSNPTTFDKFDSVRM